MATPPPCPRPSWLDLPNLSRDIPAFMFVPMCLPGTETASGCPADKAFFTIAVPWGQFLAEGWVAPGGNRYWSAPRFPANLKDPKVVGLLQLMAARSHNYFQDRATSKELRNLKVTEIIGKPVPSKPTQKVTMKPGGGMTITVIPGTPDIFNTSYGHMSIAVQPNPGETMAAFAKRGGYLLHTDGAQTMRNGFLLQSQGSRPWMGSKVRSIQLWGDYNPVEQKIGYTLRLEYEGAWAQTVSSVDKWARENLSALCDKLNSPEAIAATTILGAFPATAPYLVAYGVVLTQCGLAQMPKPACVPQGSPVPGAYVPPSSGGGIVLTPGRANVAVSAGSSLPGGGTLAPLIRPGGPAPEINSPYPPGTIAWLDSSVNAYRIGVPFAGPGVTHAVRPETLATLPPVGILVVDKAQWIKATVPWIQRPSTKIGLGVFVGLVATAGIYTAATR